MNEARIVIGLSSAMLGYAGFRYSLDYARNRPQGRSPGDKDPAAPQVAIVQHADVRRMLLAQKVYVESALALGLHAALLVDRQKNDPDPAVREESHLLLEFLTPVIKAWSAEWSLQANSHAIQILGGYGYTRDYPVEQYFRDNRLNPIHEGTNGIQAIDLLGRKVVMQKGRALKLFLREARSGAALAARRDALKPFARALEEALERLEEVTQRLVQASGESGPARALANASAYLELVGHTVAAWMWLRQAIVAEDKLPGATGDDAAFYKGKLQACRYCFVWELPKTVALAKLLADLDATCFDMEDEWF
jgi:butyryl-CoA dehydrogenase